MNRRQKHIIAILSVILIWLLIVIGTFFIGGPDLAAENKTILVLAADKYEQPNGGCDMAFIVRLENGHLKSYDPFYPGGMVHPSQPAPGNLGGNMRFHDCLWNGVEQGMEYAKEIVEARNGTHIDAVVVIYDEGLDNIIDSVRPLEVDGEVTNTVKVNKPYDVENKEEEVIRTHHDAASLWLQQHEEELREERSKHVCPTLDLGGSNNEEDLNQGYQKTMKR